MIVLGIESSCDETAAAILDDSNVLSSCIYSQIETHKKYGGVIPEIAAREHVEKINPIVEQALVESNKEFSDIDLIAVANGPGLVGSLLIGVNYAKGLGISLSKPVVPVNHVHAHIHSLFLNKSHDKFPMLALVASGGHTHLYKLNSINEFSLLGFSQDDACGESFDKTAKLLGLDYPGGPVIDRLAKQGDKTSYRMPVVSVKNSEYNFSFSGIKTHMYRLLQKLSEAEKQSKLHDICASFQNAAIEQLFSRIKLAIDRDPSIQAIGIAGGVSANSYLRERLEKLDGQQILLLPEMHFCADNAAMIAHLGWSKYIGRRGDSNTKLPSETNPTSFKNQSDSDKLWDVFPRYPYQQQQTASN